MTTITNTNTAKTMWPTAGLAVSMAAFARPDDTTGYTAGDVVSDTGAAKAIAFPNCGRCGAVMQASLIYGETDTASFDLLLFDAEPTNHADNAPLACVAADAPKLIGLIRFDNAMKVNIGSSLELYRALGSSTELPMAPLAYSNANATLYGLLVTRSTFTPASASTVTLALHLKLGE
jgi:hypothetical protein